MLQTNDTDVCIVTLCNFLIFIFLFCKVLDLPKTLRAQQKVMSLDTCTQASQCMCPIEFVCMIPWPCGFGCTLLTLQGS